MLFKTVFHVILTLLTLLTLPRLLTLLFSILIHGEGEKRRKKWSVVSFQSRVLGSVQCSETRLE